MIGPCVGLRQPSGCYRWNGQLVIDPRRVIRRFHPEHADHQLQLANEDSGIGEGDEFRCICACGPALSVPVKKVADLVEKTYATERDGFAIGFLSGLFGRES